MRIAIVNNNNQTVKALQEVLATVPEYEVAWVARDGTEAVARSATDTPDLILMDLQMPGIDGVEAMRRIAANSRCAILVVTSDVSANASKVFEAMGYGALDAVNAPVTLAQGRFSGEAEILAKIATIGKLIGKPVVKKSKPQPAAEKFPPTKQCPPLIAIGSSTGGPKALADILSQLPTSLRAGVVIVQHLDAQFSSGMVEWLNTQTQLPVKVALAGDSVEAGKVLMTGTNDHLICRANLTLGYTPQPRSYPYRPSVDVFFNSLAEHWPDKAIAVLLTGMGRDGALGLKRLRTAGWHTIAQDKETSSIYGMPKAAAELGAAVEILPIGAIAPALLKLTLR